MKLFTKPDLLLIALVLLVGTLPFFTPWMKSGGFSSGSIQVCIDGKLIHSYTLNQGRESQIISFDFEHQGVSYQGQLETKEGKVRLLRLPKTIVPRSVHADMGWISSANQMIVALPVRMTVRIVGGSLSGDEEEVEVDVIAH